MIIFILVNIAQLIGILVPFVGCVSLIRKAHSRTSMYLLLANLGCLIINGSYMLLLQTKTYEGALIALKMEYFGNIVFYLMFGMFLWTYMKLKHYKWAVALISFWSIFDVLFLLAVWTGDPFHLAFQNLDFEWNANWGLVMLRSEPAIFYMLHYCIIGVIGLCGMVYILVRMFLVPIRSERKNLARLAVAQFVLCASLSIMLLFNLPFDIVPICASLSIVSIIISVRRDAFFGITELGHGWVFEQMGDAFVIVDKMYGYLDSNSYANKIFPELNERRKNEIVSGELLRIFMNEEQIMQIDIKHYQKKVMEIWDKGEVAGYSLLLADVTQQYELMERIQEEKERADAANQAKSAFVSNVSHEIRTPMNAIVGMTQILLRRNLPQQERDYLLNIQNSGNALLAIVNDLLDMSKIESGKMELVDEAYDFMAILSDLGMIILNRIGTKPVELLFDIDPDIPAQLYGDALRIRQIIINFMNNATKFTEEGTVSLTVKVNQVLQEDIELYISVKDTGQGIRQEDIGKLFGTFQQVDVQKNHHKEGTGLGLSISKQLVELMNGTIGVASEYGKGSDFYFTIHQRIVKKERAVSLPQEKQTAVICGNMKNPAANAMLQKLAESYQLAYVEDIFAKNLSVLAERNQAEQGSASIYYFTDSYETLGMHEKEILAKQNASICVLRNPMTEGELPENLPMVNKPLYSDNFCRFLINSASGQQVLDNRGTAQAQLRNNNTVPQNNAVESVADVAAAALADTEFTDTAFIATEFTAPEAHILIVDDNEINRMIAVEMLEPLQMQIETAVDGQQALEMIQEKHYDLIFMDHFMPKMNGIEAVSALREMEDNYYKEVPVIALTANTAKEQKEEYKKAGMNGYLSKPMDLDQLYEIIRKWLPDKICYEK